MPPSTLELTSFQKEVWLAQQGLPEGHPGISACGRFLLQGHMDENIVRQSLQRLIEHYPLLTASLVQGEGYPVFMLNTHNEVDFTYYDVHAHENPQAEADRICQECAQTPFIPLGGKLIRFLLVRFAKQKYYFLNQSFHLVNDGIFSNAAAYLLSIIYEDILANRPTDWLQLPPWQHTIDADKAHLESARYKRDKEFWLKSVQDAPDIRAFPSLTQNTDTFNPTRLYAHKLSQMSVTHFQSLLAEGSGMGALLTSIHAITLHLMYDTNVPVNMTINNGERKKPMNMQGYMMNIIPIVPNIDADTSLSEIQKDIAQQSYRVRKHAKTSITLALREAKILKDFLHLWDTTINFVPSFAFKNSHFHLVKIVPFFPSQDTALLYIHATQDTDTSPLDLYIQYSQNHFTLDDVKRYALRFEKVLTLLATQGHKTLRQCSVLLDDEYEKLKKWEQGKKVKRPNLSIPALFAHVAEQYAQNPAIRSVEGESITYAKLLENVQAFANHLLAHNIAQGHVVAVLARRHHMLPECILGIMHIGAIYLPIDPDYPLERIMHMFEDAKVCCIVAFHEEDFEISGLTELLAKLPAKLKPHCPKILWNAEQQKNALDKAVDIKGTKAHDKANDAAYLIYTSGSTGKPKGVLVGHKSFVNMILCQVEIMGVRPSDHALHFASPSFDASMAEIFLPLMAGACLYPVPRELIDMPLNLHTYLTENAITVATLPPSYLALFDGKPFPTLRVLLTAGEAPVAKDAKHYANECAYYNAYGPTEFSVCASMYRIHSTDTAYNIIGRPIANTAAYILDSHGRRVAPGMVGELWLSGEGLALGYYDKPDATAMAFCKPQALPETLCYKTGDRAAWNTDGNLIIFGRSDSQVKIHGHRIELLEITRILEKHSSLSQAIVLLIKKQDASMLEAFVVPNATGAQQEADDLKSELLAWVRAHLPSFACPNFFHILESLPIAPTGKVDRKALEKRAINKNAQEQIALSSFEDTLRKIFNAILGYEVQDPHQDFFALGGDSLKAMQLVQKLHTMPEMQTTPSLSMRDFLDNSSITRLSDFIKRHHIPTHSLQKAPPKRLKSAHDPIACTSAQLALWAQELAHPSTDRYHMPCIVYLDGKEQDIAQFLEAMHTALGNQPLCTSRIEGPIEAPQFMPFSQEIPLCEQLSADNDSQYQAHLARVIHRPFRLMDESLVRLALIQKNYSAAKQKVFIMVLHHIIADAASLDALWQEALRLLDPHPHILPNLKQERSALLRDAALDEQVFLHSTTRQEEVSFWKERLFPIPRPLSKALVTTQEKHPSGRLALTLNALVSERIQELAKHNSTSLLSVIMALLGDFLCNTAKQSQCFLTIPMGTRDHAKLEQICGYFTNPMPLRLTPEQGALNENIQQAKKALYSALGHNTLPIHELAKDLRLSADNHAALNDVFVTHMHLSLPNVDFPLDIELISPLEHNIYLRAVKAPLSFMLMSKGERLGERLGLVLEYAEDIFSKEQAQDFMHACMRHIVKSIDCAHETCEIKDFSLNAVPSTLSPCPTKTCSTAPLSSVATQPIHENAATQELAKAWEKVLGHTPKDADNFFLHGGDSIKAIQFIGHLHRVGYTHMTPAHCYEYPTYAALLAHISTVQATQTLPTTLASPLQYNESIALPPFHRQWVLRHPLSWSDFHMALPLLFHAPIDLTRLKQALTDLATRHEALCLRLKKNTAGEVHFVYEQASPPLWLEFEYNAHSLAQCFAATSKELFAQLSTAKNDCPLYACAVFTHEGKHYALLGMHHFCVDIFSFEIIKADLFALYTHTEQHISSIGAASYAKLIQGVEGQKVPSVFTSEQDYLDELDFWHTEIAMCTPEKFYPVEHKDISPPERAQLSATVENFSYDASRRGGGLPEILAGLSMALADMHEAPLLLTLEGHGREQVLPHVDISHTVAWFTSAFPLAIKAHVEYELLDNLPTLWANKLDSIPMRGARFAFAAMHDALLSSYVPHMSLNYIGNMQNAAQDEDWQSLSQFASPSALPGLIGKNFVSDCPIEMTLLLNEENTLTIDASYDSQKCAASWLEGLLQAWGKAITTLSQIQRARMIHIDSELAALCQCEPDDILAVSHPVQAEEVMLFQHLLDKEAHDSINHYMVQICFNLKPEQRAGHPPIQVHILEQAWHELCRRHEALRMLFPRKEFFIRAVLKEPRYYAECVDLSNLPLDQQNKKQDALLQQLRSTPFDFNCGPLLYLSLMSRKDAQGPYVVMAWTFSHVLMDGWCIGIMIHELQELYAAKLEHRAPNLDSAPSLSKIYAELGQSSLESLKGFWSTALEGFSGATSLVHILNKRLNTHNGHTYALPDIQGIKYTEDVVQEYSFALAQDELELLHQAAAQYSVSLAQLLQSLWGILLSDAHNKDVVFGVVFAARPAHIKGIENTLGLFLRTLPVRVRWHEDMLFQDLAIHIRKNAVQLGTHERDMLSDIQNCRPNGGALFDHSLTFENYPLDFLKDNNMLGFGEVDGFERAPYPLTFSVYTTKQSCNMRFVYNTDHIHCEKFALLVHQWQTLLHTFMHKVKANEAQSLLCKELCTAYDPHTYKSDTSETLVPMHQEDTAFFTQNTLHEIFLKQVELYPIEPAYISAQNDVWSYSELAIAARRIAAGLKDILPHEPIAIAIPRGPENMAAILGVLMAGGCYLSLDEHAPIARQQNMLETAQCRHIIFHHNVDNALYGQGFSYSCLNFDELILHKPLPPEKVKKGGGQSRACMIFTSGTTGTPKGIVLPHQGILRFVCQSNMCDIKPQERLGQASSLAFDASNFEIWGALLNGGTLCGIELDTLTSTSLLKKELEQKNISTIFLTTGLFSSLSAVDPSIFASLSKLYTGGEILNTKLTKDVLTACPTLQIYNGYGPAENSTYSMGHWVRLEDVQDPAKAVPIGLPVSHTRVYIIDEHDNLVQDGEWGEICVAGLGLALGYYNKPEATQRAFVMLKSVGEKVYRTGDIGRMGPEGVYEFAGRRDNQVKIRGFRVELDEIEQAFLHVSGIKQAVILVRGEHEHKKLVAFVMGKDIPSQDLLYEKLRHVLPEYMLPTQILALEQFPLTSNAKLDRAALLKMLDDGMLSSLAHANIHDTGMAQGEKTEQNHAEQEHAAYIEQIGKIFSTVLQIPWEKIAQQGPEVDFFHLGGQSLKAIHLLGHLQKAFGLELRLSDIMQLRTITNIAKHISTLKVQNSPHKEQLHPISTPDLPLLPEQKNFWFLHYLMGQSSKLNIISPLHINNLLNMTILNLALRVVEMRHEALRLRFSSRNELQEKTEARQWISSSPSLQVSVQDLRLDVGTDADRAKSLRKAIEADYHTPFIFENDASLIRAHYYIESETSSVLSLVAHHIICDGWSMNVILNDIHLAYTAILAATQRQDMTFENVSHSDLNLWTKNIWPTSPPSYAHILDKRLRNTQEAMLQRLIKRFTPLPEPLMLPTDFARTAVQSFESTTYMLSIPHELRNTLHSKAKAYGVPVFALLLALTKIFLFKHSKQKDVVLGIPVACRDTLAAQETVGLLMNVTPVRLQLNVEDNFKSCALKCAEVFGLSLQDAEYPFNELLQHINVPREDGHSPLYDMVLSYEEQEWKEFSDFCGQTANIYELDVNNNRLDITLNIINMPDSLQFHWQYKEVLFTKASIERMAKRFITLLKNICADCADTLPVSALDIVPEEEKSLLASFNNTHTTFENFHVTKGIYEQFAHQARLTPHALALHHTHGAISYADFAMQVERLATWLHAQNITAGTAVGIALPRSVDMMRAIYATLRLGAYYVPLIASDADFPKERVSFMLQDLPRGSYILSTAKLAPQLASIAELAQDTTLLTMPDIARLDTTSTAPMTAQNLQDLAYIIFTSGSTGRPKGVMVESQGVLNRIFWMQDVFKLDAHDVILQKTPISFDVSVWELFWWAWSGASVVLLEPDEERYPDAIVEAIWRHKVSTIHFVPSMLHIFLEHCQNVPQSIERIASLKRVFVSGEAINYDCVQLFNKLLFESNATELHNLYGPTEATVDVTWQPCSPFVVNADTPAQSTPRVPIGKAISNTQIDIVDDFDQVCPIGVTGELIISGIQVARGYANRPDLTEQAFRQNFFNDLTQQQRSYRTGDLARYTAEGHIEYLGRKDHQVKVRGFRIELGEIEAALESHARINKAVVRLGTLGNMPSLEAFILPQEQHGPDPRQAASETQLTVQELRQYLQGLLPTYMCPSSFFIMPHMELSAHGKFDRKNLQGTRLRALGNTQPRQEGVQDAPQSTDTLELKHIEADVRTCWYEVLPELKEHASRLTHTVSFFEAGGSSLLLIRLFELLNARWPNVFQMAELFVCINIQEQAQKIYASLQPAKEDVEQKAAHVSNGTASKQQENTTQDTGQDTDNKDIAIIGLALRLADYTDEESFWSDLMTQGDRVCALSPAREREQRAMLSAAGVPHEGLPFQDAAYLDDISSFDPQRFTMSPSEARIVDPEHRMFFATALRALENAGYGGDALRAQEVGVFVGASAHSTFRQAVAFGVPEQAEQSAMINIPSALTARLSYLYNWTGPAAVLDTACSSGLVAMHHACMALHNGDCSVALCGAVRVEDGLLLLPNKFAIVSNNQRTYSFEARASGTTGGEGAIVFLLKPLKHALRDNDSIHAIIKGSAVNQDGQGSSLVAPNPVAQANVIIKAAQQVAQSAQRAKSAESASFSLNHLSFIEAHGTGTVLGDPAEVEGLRRALASSPPNASMPISSVKGNFGHLDAAAGSLGLLKAVLCLKHALLPAQAHFEKPNPHIDFAKAHVHVPATAEKLSRVHGALKAGVSSFGLSGINAHVILEEAPEAESTHYAPAYYCIVLSAASTASLRTYVREMLIHLEKSPKHIRDVAATLSLGRTHLAIRVAFVAKDTRTLCKKFLHWLCASDFRPENNDEKSKNTTSYMCHEDEARAHAAAKAFMQGATPLWADATQEHLGQKHFGQSFKRVHLPAVPMERVTCWPNFAKRPQKHSRQHATKQADFLGPAIYTPHGQHYALDVENTAFWPLHEHKILRKPTLVGMAFPALIATIMQGINAAYTALQVRNIVWHAPLLAENYTHISLQRASHEHDQDATQHMSLMGQAEHTWTTFVEAKVHILASPHDIEPIDIEHIHQDMLKHDLVDFSQHATKNSALEVPVLEVSERWQCRTALWRSSDSSVTVSRLALKPEYIDDLQSFSLHPALLDIATSSAFETTANLLPAACKSISIYHPLSAHIWVRCCKKSTTQSERNLLIDCSIYDDHGRILVHFEDLVFLPLREDKALLHRLDWKNQPSPITQAQAQTQAYSILLLDNAPSNIMQELEDLGHTVTCMPYPQDDKTCTELIAKLQQSHIFHVFAVLPQDISPWQGILPLRHILQNISQIKTATSSPLSWLYLAKQYSPEHAAIRGAFMALCQEDTRLRGIFVEAAKADLSNIGNISVQNICDALLSPLDNTQVTGLRPWLRLDTQGRLLTPSLSKALTPPTKQIRSTNNCIVITGGLGSLALSMARELVPTLGSTLALLHKSPFSLDIHALDTTSRAAYDEKMQERLEALSTLDKQGIPYKLYQCDVTHAKELEACLEKVRADCGPIGSIIHTAGLAGAGFMLHKDQSTFESVVDVKLHAARLLYEFTKQDPIAYFILTSSRTGLMGAAGQSDYTAANAALDALAHELRQHDYPAFSIAWNTLSEVGMAARAGIHEAHMLHPKRAAKTLLEALALNEPHIILSLAGEFLDSQGINTGFNTVQTADLNNNPHNSITEGLENFSTVEALCTIIKRVLGHEYVDINDDFYALGGDSLSGMRIIATLNEYFKISLNLSDLLTNSKLADFSKYITDKAHDVKKHSTILSPSPQLEEYPVSREQQAVLLKEALTEAHTGYNLPSFFPLKDVYSKEHVQKALDALIDRHEILRTRFVHMAELSPRMRILDSVQCIVTEYHFDTLSDALSLVQAFDFDHGLLFRMAVLHIARLPHNTPQDTSTQSGKVLFFDLHHSLSDAKGLGILIYEFFALLRGEGLAPVHRHMKDAAWQQHINKDAEVKAREYWLNIFADAHTKHAQGSLKTTLPEDFARPPFYTFKGDNADFFIAAEETHALQNFAKTQKITLNALIRSLWALLIYADTKATDIALGLATDTRPAGFEQCVGMLACLLPTRIHIEPHQTLSQYVRKVQSSDAMALEHMAFSESDILTELRLPADPSRLGLSEIIISFMNYATGESELAPYILPNNACSADLTIYISNKDGGLLFALQYYAHVFSKARMEALGKRFVKLAHTVLASHAEDTLQDILRKSAVIDRHWQVRGQVKEQVKGEAQLTPHTVSKPHQKAHSALNVHEAEHSILTVFHEYFGEKSFGADMSFFELGGHSLLAVQIVNAINKHYNSTLSARDIFSHPSPRLLAKQLVLIMAHSVTQNPQQNRINHAAPLHGEYYPLSHAQQRLYVLHRMEEESTAYNMVFVFHVKKPLEKHRLEKALQALSQRQDILRTIIVEKEGHIYQKLVPDVINPCHEYEGTLPKDKACAWVSSMAIKPYDLSKSMLRMCLCTTTEHEQYLAIGMHHILGDGWSMQIFARELMAFYVHEAHMPPLPLQYRDYALAQQHKTWQEEAAWWKNALKNPPKPMSLPTDASPMHAHTHGIRQREDTQSRIVSAETVQALRTLASEQQISLATYLLTLLSALLMRLARQDDIIIGMGVAGRDESNIEGLIGFFVNMLPIRIKAPKDGTLESLLKAVQYSCGEALARASYPYDILVRECLDHATSDAFGDASSNVSGNTSGMRQEQLFNIVFEYQRYSDLQHNIPMHEAENFTPIQEDDWLPMLENSAKSARYPITFYAQDEPAGLRLRAQYDSELFSAKSIASWLELWEGFMHKVVNQ